MAVDPLLVNPNCGGGVHDLLVSGGKVYIVAVDVDFAGDFADPPAVVVEGVDALVEREGRGGGDARRLRAELSGKDG